jgi:serine-type D-Ala-D-Ala carboxypeptidase/endopeptidase (penicillin-binding protein 4)
MRQYPVFIFGFFLLLASCSVQKRIGRAASATLLGHEALQTAHIGISVFDPSSGKFLYDHEGDKYFVPASNVKIATCYAAMTYLGDSIPGILYRQEPDRLIITPTGDPAFLHPAFHEQKVFAWLTAAQTPIYLNMDSWEDEPWGNGWSWNDFEAPYMAERTAMPIYGNVLRMDSTVNELRVVPAYFADIHRSGTVDTGYLTSVQRKLASNTFTVTGGGTRNQVIERSFYTDNGRIIYALLSDTLQKPVHPLGTSINQTESPDTIFSQATDSVLRPMMHESDNFIAEQTLLMVSRILLGEMNDSRVIDTLLKTDLKGLPQRPRWADGSGLSRYNLFTPRDFVWLLQQMQRRFGMQRIRNIFPTGNEGTLSGYYKSDSGYLYAKTGTLSGVVALSGYIYTRKNRLLIFSILVNNHQASSATLVRRSMESFLQLLRSRY